jgi:hypothetical protein
MAGREFVLVVVDLDTGEFTVEGPMSDDRPWNRAVVKAQEAGRSIRCFAMGNLPADAAASEWQSLRNGAKRIARGSIVSPVNLVMG